ncbi:MAG: BamA/TamA family outer membrane protein [Steroidobacteraceae bacterium]
MRISPAAQGLMAAMLALCAAVARADIKVTVTGIDGAPRNNIEARLSIERYRERDDLDEDTARRLSNRIDNEVKDALRPFGFYEPVVNWEYHAEGNDWHFDIRVEPGMPVRISELAIEITGPGAGDASFDAVRKQKVLQVNMILHHSSYEEVKGEMTRAAAASGYLAARLVEDDRLVVDPAAHAARIKLLLETGPRYNFGHVDIDQDVIRPALMQRFLRFREGAPYNASDVLRTQFALDDSLYFSSVDVELGTPDDKALTVPIRITATKSRWQLALGGGYGTDTQLRGTLGWTNTRLNDRGHRLRFELKASASTRRLNARYDIPIGDPALEKFSVEVINKFEDLADLDTNETTVRPSVTRVHDRWQTVTSLSATHTSTDDGASRVASTLLVPGFAVAAVPRGFLGESLFSRAFYAEIIGSHSALGSDADFLRIDLQAERKFDLGLRWHLLLRGEFGASVVSDFSDVPGIYRFFAGGDRSVRGFAYNTLSPEEFITQRDGSLKLSKTGGRHLVVGSAEIVRDLPLNLGVATFFDIGNAFNSFKDPLEYAAGVGIRYRLPIVSLGLDVAKPLSTSGNLRLHLNISTSL